ncbi:hypothetical protein BVH03_25095 [Pseudomonas sp. PA15(2017)]|uniref:hypothetical protein n=1 Tax=Pseudomonas sp. PA15(2017) TaxID=1932111 RepID=UPI00095AF3B6|nr:hypothetical protein [Pseudomonas sp. PA15(2017)]OLU22500.1 hypothetical protein BVH03_25095 [Pseudomonas sp. PA15(2017)]
MQSYHYKSAAPETVAIVVDYYQAKDRFLGQLNDLGKLIGGKVAPMHDVGSNFAGGVKLSDSRELDAHWCRPDEWGFRGLRSAPKLPKGITKEERAAIRAEHERLQQLWQEHCPARLSSAEYWDRLSINTGNLWLCGGIMFEHQNTAYFNLGFSISQADHEAALAAGQPTSGWIEGASEILPSEYQTARQAKLEARA